MPQRLILEVEGEVKLSSLPGCRTRIEVVPTGAGEEKLLSKKEVAERFGVSKRTIENWTKAQRNPLPVINTKGHPRFSEADIALWLSKGRSQGMRGNAQ
jgi:excisionase family DNA binding protein